MSGPVSDLARAVERTRLSWRRTTLAAATVVVIAAFRYALTRSVGRNVTGVAVVALAWVAVFVVCQRRIARLDRAVADPAASERVLRSAGTAGSTPIILALLVTVTAIGGVLAIA